LVSSLIDLNRKHNEPLLTIRWKLDFFEEIIRIISFLTYYSPTITPKMWTLFPKMYQAFEEWAIDYIGNILVPMDNFISRSTEVFLTPGTPYLEMVFNMYKKVSFRVNN